MLPTSQISLDVAIFNAACTDTTTVTMAAGPGGQMLCRLKFRSGLVGMLSNGQKWGHRGQVMKSGAEDGEENP